MRISFSIANAWWEGKQNEALAMLNGEDFPYPIETERAFSFGHGWHKAMEIESSITKKFPAVYGLPDVFEVIATEQKLRTRLPNGDLLSGVIDVVARHKENGMIVIGDYKSGVNYKEMQAFVYHVLVHNHPWWVDNVGAEPTHAFFLTLNKNTNQTYNNIVQLTYPKTPEDWDDPNGTTFTAGLNWIMTICDDIKNNLGLE